MDIDAPFRKNHLTLSEAQNYLDEFRRWAPIELWENIPDNRKQGSNSDKAVAYRSSKKYLYLKKLCLKLAGEKCCKCGEIDDLQLHHLTYKSYFNEKIEHCCILCSKCHKEDHFKIKLTSNLSFKNKNRSKVMSIAKNKSKSLQCLIDCQNLLKNSKQKINKKNIYDSLNMNYANKLHKSTVSTVQSFLMHILVLEVNNDEWQKTRFTEYFLQLSKSELTDLLALWNKGFRNQLSKDKLDKKGRVMSKYRMQTKSLQKFLEKLGFPVNEMLKEYEINNTQQKINAMPVKSKSKSEAEILKSSPKVASHTEMLLDTLFELTKQGEISESAFKKMIVAGISIK